MNHPLGNLSKRIGATKYGLNVMFALIYGTIIAAAGALLRAGQPLWVDALAALGAAMAVGGGICLIRLLKSKAPRVSRRFPHVLYLEVVGLSLNMVGILLMLLAALISAFLK